MKKVYRWDRHFLNENLKKLVNLNASSKSSEEEKILINDSIEVYLDMIWKMDNIQDDENDFYDDNDVLEDEYLESFFRMMSSYEKNSKFLLNGQTLNIIKSLAELKYLPQAQFKKLNISEEGRINSAKNFYKSLDLEIYEKLLKIEDKNPSFYHFTESLDNYGYCYVDQYNNLPYIIMQNSQSIIDLYVLVHEIAHAIDFTNNIITTETDVIVEEAIPTALEMILTSNYENKKELTLDAKILSSVNFNDIITLARRANLQADLFDVLKKDKIKTMEGLYRRFPNLKQNHLEQLLFAPYIDSIQRIYSNLIATELFSQYKHNQKEGLKNLKTVLLRDKRKSTEYLYGNIDINLKTLNTNSFLEKQKELLLN